MLKKERLLSILNMVNEQGIITVNDIVNTLGVSTMTVRRDLDELSSSDQLIRIHGGAQSINNVNKIELSYHEKKKIHVKEKKEIAQTVASMIEERDTVFLGPGTTVEFVAEYLDLDYIRIVTNSLPVFEQFKEKSTQYDLLLIGGSYRMRSGAFIGNIADEMLSKLRMDKTFVSVNGILNDKVTNASPEEGNIQRIALNSAKKRYIMADHYKLNREDFYGFYNLQDISAIITDSGISPDINKYYNQYTEIISKRREKK